MNRSVSLARLADYVNGRPFRPEDFAASGLPVVRIRQFLDPAAEPDYFAGPVEERHRLRDGDLVFCWSASLAVGLWDRGPAVLNQHLFNVHPAPDVDKRWLRWALQHTLKVFTGMMHGSAMTHITKEMLRQVVVKLPSINEQRRVADFLDDQVALLDRAIHLRQRQATLVRSALDSTVSDWVHAAGPLVPLRRLLMSITDGPFGSSLTSAHYCEDGARVIRLGNVGAGEFKDEDVAYISWDYYEQLAQHAVEPGDLLIAGLGDEKNPLGRACLVPAALGPAIVKADCYRVRLRTDVVAHAYAALVISSLPITEATRVLSRGATRERINTEVARDIAIPVPSLAEQERLAAEIAQQRAATEQAKRSMVHSVALLEERKQALITAAVTGELDVTTSSARSVA